MASRCLSFMMAVLSSLVVPRRSTAEALETRAEFLNEILIHLGVATGSHSFATRGFLDGAATHSHARRWRHQGIHRGRHRRGIRRRVLPASEHDFSPDVTLYMASPGVGWECDFGSRYLLRTDIAWAEALPGRHEHQGDLAVIRWTGRQVAAEVKSFGESCLFETISNHGHPSYVGVGLRRRY